MLPRNQSLPWLCGAAAASSVSNSAERDRSSNAD
jgi:hypothetical protein